MAVTHTATWGHAMLVLVQLRAISVSVALLCWCLWPLQIDACCLRPCWCPRVLLPQGPYTYEWLSLSAQAMVTSGPQLQPRAMSGSVALLQPGSVMISVAHVTTEGCVNAASTGELSRVLAPVVCADLCNGRAGPTSHHAQREPLALMARAWESWPWPLPEKVDLVEAQAYQLGYHPGPHPGSHQPGFRRAS